MNDAEDLILRINHLYFEDRLFSDLRMGRFAHNDNRISILIDAIDKISLIELKNHDIFSLAVNNLWFIVPFMYQVRDKVQTYSPMEIDDYDNLIFELTEKIANIFGYPRFMSNK
jgi:hypothetical protein